MHPFNFRRCGIEKSTIWPRIAFIPIPEFGSAARGTTFGERFDDYSPNVVNSRISVNGKRAEFTQN
jgi:hypothetical protein